MTSLIVEVLGGLGLILLGMKLMTDGLKLAGGPVLKRVIGGWTDTPVKGLAAGAGITALVQSSSAVSVAAIGFVNAGLINLVHAVWIVYGANVGTTSTAWIVAFLGLKVNIKALALPLIGFGTALWLAGGVARRTAVGEALAGFGLFFLGIELLQETMGGVGQTVNLAAIPSAGLTGALVYAGIGFVFTFLMQSSSASMALILTATAGGLAPLESAAAAVIGANLGTTSTAAIASIGATSGAKRLAAAHVVFNVVTGLVALVILAPTLAAILAARSWLGLGAGPQDAPTVLAVYHTVFNVLGVALMWPLTGSLTAFLARRFTTREEERGRPRHLDGTVVRTPGLALSALCLEAGRLGESARRMAISSFRCQERPCRDLMAEKQVLESLQKAVTEFASKLRREGLGKRTAENLPLVLRVAQYFNASAEASLEAEELRHHLEPLDAPAVQAAALASDQLFLAAEACIDGAAAEEATFDVAAFKAERDAFEAVYQEAKAALLKAGTDGALGVEAMVTRLDYISRVRRSVQQLAKGALMLFGLREAYGLNKAGV